MAQPTGLDVVHVTLVAHDSTIKYVVDEIARQAHLQPVYYNKPQVTKHISVHLVNAGVSEAFAKALQGTGLEAKVVSEGEMVVIRNVPASVAAASRSAGGIVTGRVTDSASGAGLGGAAVRIERFKVSAVTSDSGRFTLRNVPVGEQVLSVKLFGYRPAERTVTVVDSSLTTVRIVMTSIPTVLSGVVTTATGLQRKVEVGNDITTLNVDSIRQVAPITSVTDLLETRVPGLTVLHTSGVPGDPSRIRLRGVGSVTGENDPVVIVDGVRVYASQSDVRNNNLAPSLRGGSSAVGNNLDGSTSHNLAGRTTAYAAPSPLDQIDPSSIDKIEVFKGPSASALYGSDAASGVIVITTKHGRAGPTHWNIALGQGVNWIPGTWPANYYRFGYDGTGLSRNVGGLCQWNDLNCAVDSVVPFQALNDPQYTVFSHGSDQSGSLAVSGGVSALQYSLGGSVTGGAGNLKLPAIEQQRYEQFYGSIPGWMVRPDKLQTWGVSGQVSASPNTTTRVTMMSSLFNSTQQRSSLEQAITQLEGEYINNGNFVGSPIGPPTGSLTNYPLIRNEVERATAGSLTSTNALTLAWQPVSWLPLTATGGLNTMERNDQTFIPFGVNVGGPGNSQNSEDTTGSYGVGHGTSEDKTLTVGSTIPTWHNRVTLGVGGNWYTNSTADVGAYTDLLSPGVTLPSSFPTSGCNLAVPGCSTFSQSTTASSTYGWYVEPRLNVNSRFFAAPGFRLDGGSASGAHGGFAGTGLTGFPKIDLSYVAVDQSHPRGVVTLFRPRIAFGFAGTQPGPTEKLRLFNIGGGMVVPLNDSTLAPSVDVSQLGNTRLRPETSSEVEGGFDTELGHGRIALTYTQYNKTRHNAIIPIAVAPSVFGVSQMINVNVGVVRNTGTEVQLTTQLLQSRALSWTVGANLSNDNNQVVRLDPSFVPNKALGIVVGYPLFSLWQYPIVGFADLNHDNLIEKNEVVIGDSMIYMGQANPKYQLNLNTDVTLLNGRLSVHATLAYQNGMTQNNQGAIQSGAVNFIASMPGTPLATQAAVVAAENNLTYIGVIQTVNTFRFNDLSINYVLPARVASLFRVSVASVALQGSNLGLHTNYRGKDPDVNAFSTVVAGDETADLGQIPEPRTWWLKLSLGN